jgi:hypothetical protein
MQARLCSRSLNRPPLPYSVTGEYAMKISKSARILTVGLAVPFALMAATSAIAKDEKKEGGALKGAAKGAAVGAIVPGVSAGTGAAIGAVSGGVKAGKDKKEDKKKE